MEQIQASFQSDAGKVIIDSIESYDDERVLFTGHLWYAPKGHQTDQYLAHITSIRLMRVVA